MTQHARQPTRPEPRSPLDRNPPLGASRERTRSSEVRPHVDGPTRADAGSKPSNAAWVLLLPLMCCGGPLLIAAAASAGALGWGGLGAGIAVLIAAGVLFARRHAGRSCNTTAGASLPHARTEPTPDRRLPR